MKEVFAKTSDGWFDFWICKRCGHKMQLIIDDKPLPPTCPECGYGSDIKEDKDMTNKFACPICGKTYDTVLDMVDCALACDKQKNEKNKEQAINDITAKYEELKQLISKFNATYSDMVVGIRMDVRTVNTGVKSVTNTDTTNTNNKLKSWTKFPNEFSVPLNFKRNNSFENIVDAFLKGDK